MKEKGITLIALVITIIILFILASVTIATLTGDNGLIAKAMEAREKTEIGEIEEQLRLAQLSAKLKKQGGDITIEDLLEELEKQGVDFEIEEDGTLIINGNYIYEMEEKDGEVSWQNNGTITTPKPKILSIEIVDTTETTIKIKVTTSNSGLSKIKWFYKKSTDESYTSVEDVYQVSEATAGATTEQEKTRTLTGLTSGTTYSIYAEVYNVEGNKTTSSTITADTLYTTQDIANSTNKSEFYGAIVTGYTCQNSAGVKNWKIFYADTSNIYLIADDYISYAYTPKGKGGSSLIKTDTDYQLSFNNILSDYSGSSDITDARIKALNNDYFTKGYTSTNNNMKVVAYMLDTNVWSVYKGEKAEYAIGGPTIELLFKSYNQKYGTNYQMRASSNIGYEISVDGGANWNTDMFNFTGPRDSLYGLDSVGLPKRFWLSSPSLANGDYILCMGDVLHYGTYGNWSFGIRPMVCLNSNVQLEKNADGTYTII